MPGFSRGQDQISSLIIGRDPGSPVEAGLDEPSPTGSGCHLGDTFAHYATSQISARPDYRLAVHNNERFDVRASE